VQEKSPAGVLPFAPIAIYTWVLYETRKVLEQVWHNQGICFRSIQSSSLPFWCIEHVRVDDYWLVGCHRSLHPVTLSIVDI